MKSLRENLRESGKRREREFYTKIEKTFLITGLSIILRIVSYSLICASARQCNERCDGYDLLPVAKNLC